MTAQDRAAQHEQEAAPPRGIGRRRFLGYVLAAPTLTVAAQVGVDVLAPTPAAAAVPGVVPSLPGPADIYDLNDMLTHAALPTANLITIRVDPDGTAHFALPRAEVGQGITTSTAMIIAEELDLPVERVRVTLADARPELLFNQLTGGSNTTISTFTPIRVAAAVARGRLLRAAALELGEVVGTLTAKAGVITSTAGVSLSYGDLAVKAAALTDTQVSVTLKDPEEFRVIGTGRGRVDALEAVTGRKKFAMDVQVPGALPTMVCRPPTINGTVRSVDNLAEVKALPGITDVVTVSTGVAVRGRTFGQCIDAVRALKVTWGPGTAEEPPTPPSSRNSAGPNCPSSYRRWTCSPSRSTPASPSPSPATAPWRRTAPSPTCAPAPPRSGRA